MAFNLNKNDGSDESANSKFNLSKTDKPAVTANVSTRKSNTLMYVGAGLLFVLIAGWYFLSDNDVKHSSKSSTVSKVEGVSDSTQTLPNKADEKILNNKIPVSFASGATTFATIDQSIVDELLSVLSANSGSSVEVHGYASSEGSLEMNRSISQARADAFKDYLVSKNVSPSRITAIGKGVENPIASNRTAAGRNKNRRVEVRLK